MCVSMSIPLLFSPFPVFLQLFSCKFLPPSFALFTAVESTFNDRSGTRCIKIRCSRRLAWLFPAVVRLYGTAPNVVFARLFAPSSSSSDSPPLSNSTLSLIDACMHELDGFAVSCCDPNRERVCCSVVFTSSSRRPFRERWLPRDHSTRSFSVSVVDMGIYPFYLTFRLNFLQMSTLERTDTRFLFR